MKEGTKIYSILLRLITGLFVGFIVTLFPDLWFNNNIINTTIPEFTNYNSIIELLSNSILESAYLSFQIIVLITILIFVLDYIKSLKIVEEYSNKVNSAFSLTIGVILGITYGAGILINEYNKGTLSKNEILYISTFLMICHAIIEDTLLFVIFGANLWIIISLRVIFAFILAYFCVKLLERK